MSTRRQARWNWRLPYFSADHQYEQRDITVERYHWVSAGTWPVIDDSRRGGVEESTAFNPYPVDEASWPGERTARVPEAADGSFKLAELEWTVGLCSNG
jgi:hypothetical protein